MIYRMHRKGLYHSWIQDEIIRLSDFDRMHSIG